MKPEEVPEQVLHINEATGLVTEAQPKTDHADSVDLHRIVRRGVTLFADLAARACGNVEGTPCDDLNPRYVCKYHRWLRDARAGLKAANVGTKGRSEAQPRTDSSL